MLDGKDIKKDSVILDAISHLNSHGKNVSLVMPKQPGTDYNDLAKKGGIRAVFEGLKDEVRFVGSRSLSDKIDTRLSKESHHQMKINKEILRDFNPHKNTIVQDKSLEKIEREIY